MASAVSEGMLVDELSSLSVIVELDNVQTILKWLINRKDEMRSTSSAEMARLLKTIAKYWTNSGGDVVDAISTYASRLQPQADGVGGKNRKRLAKLRDEKNMAELLLMPGKLIKELSAKKKPTKKDALLFQKALGLLILTSCPLRIKNLASLDTQCHFVWAAPGMNGTAVLNIPASETKNSQALSFPLPIAISSAIKVYMDRYRPLLTRGNHGFLFPGPKPGLPKRSDTLSKQLSALVKETLGFDVNPHLYRHIVHLIVLRQFPGAFEMVSSVLGHKSAQTALTNYGSENINIAMETYGNLMVDRSKAKPSTAPPKKQPGRT